MVHVCVPPSKGPACFKFTCHSKSQVENCWGRSHQDQGTKEREIFGSSNEQTWNPWKFEFPMCVFEYDATLCVPTTVGKSFFFQPSELCHMVRERRTTE